MEYFIVHILTNTNKIVIASIPQSHFRQHVLDFVKTILKL